MLVVDFDLLEQIADRYRKSDGYDTVAYCVNDLVPESRRDPKLTSQLTKMVTQWLEVPNDQAT